MRPNPCCSSAAKIFPCGVTSIRGAVALEQPAAEVLLQRFDVLADRARGEMQLLGGQRERAGAGGAFEGAQGVKRRKGTGHRGVSNNESDSQ
jgi:hypothetical protein